MKKCIFLSRLSLYGAGMDVWLDASLIFKSEFAGRITRELRESTSLGMNFSKRCLQHVPMFPSKQNFLIREWIPWMKHIMTRSEYNSWQVYTDGSWTPPPLSEVQLFAITNPGSKAGTDPLHWNQWRGGSWLPLRLYDGSPSGGVCVEIYSHNNGYIDRLYDYA